MSHPEELPLRDPRILQDVQAILEGNGIEDAGTESREILAAVGAGNDDGEQAIALAKRRAEGIPLAQLIGRQRFMGVDLLVTPHVLAPRLETELLGQTALRVLSIAGESSEALRIIDMGCGSGNLVCGIAHHLPRLRVWACDVSAQAIAVARQNVAALELEERVELVHGDLFTPLQGRDMEGTISAVVCNPPYISTGRLDEGSASQLLAHEPREAFDGGPYGLSVHQRVIRDAVPFLQDGGWLLMEFGVGQDRQIKLLLERARAYEEVSFVHDPAGRPRVALAQKKEGSHEYH